MGLFPLRRFEAHRHTAHAHFVVVMQLCWCFGRETLAIKERKVGAIFGKRLDV